MGLFGLFWHRSKEATFYKAMDLKDAASFNIRRGINVVAGSATGTASFVSMRSNLQGFYGRELIDAKLTKQCMKRMRKAAKHMKSFSPEVLTSAFERYVDNPKKLEEQTRKVVEQYTKDLGEFVSAYSQILDGVAEGLLRCEQFTDATPQELENMLNNFLDVIRETKVYIPEKNVLAAQDKVQVFLRNLQAINVKEVRELQRQEGKLSLGIGIGAHIFGGGWLAHRIKKAVKGWFKVELRDLTANYSTLQTQLEQKKVDALWLSRFVMHVTSLEKAHQQLGELAHDTRVMLSVVQKEAIAAVDSIERFMAMFRNQPGTQNVLARYQELKGKHDKAFELIHKMETEGEKGSSQLRDANALLGTVFQDIVTHSQKMLSNFETQSSAMRDSLQMPKAPELSVTRNP